MPPISPLGIRDLLSPETVRVGLPGSSKEEVIENLVALLDGQAAVQSIRAVKEAVLQREGIMSTGVGKGLALPHARTPAVVSNLATFAITREPVDFGSVDDVPVRLVFLLVGTENDASGHIRLLSRISRLMNRERFRERLLDAKEPEEVLAVFSHGEEDISGS